MKKDYISYRTKKAQSEPLCDLFCFIPLNLAAQKYF